MGHHPDAKIAADTDVTTAQGHLSPEIWARLVLARVNKSETGTLIVRHDSNERTFRFIEGSPICATSTLAREDFTETMVLAQTLDPARLKWIRKHTAADESEIEALIGAGTIQRQAVDSHHTIHIQHLIAATVAWPEGEFTWSPSPGNRDRFERSLLPQVNAIEGLFEGILGGFDLAALHTFVDAADAGDYLPDARMTGAKPPAWVPIDMAKIHTKLGQGLSRTEIAAALTLDPDRVAAMLWLLEATGWAKRAHPPAALLPLGTVATLQPGSASASADRPVPPPTTAVPPVSESAPSAPKQETAEAKAAPTPTPTPTPENPPTTTSVKQDADPEAILNKAIRAIADSDFDAAYRLLSNVRKDRPSCPDTLAALGWTSWRTENLGTNAYDGPEDFLLLALTFDAAHPKALEYFARIAIEKGEKENARNRLLQVLGVTPDAPWALEALEALSPKGAKSSPRLWPKGRS
jgi:hypothetical protein